LFKQNEEFAMFGNGPKSYRLWFGLRPIIQGLIAARSPMPLEGLRTIIEENLAVGLTTMEILLSSLQESLIKHDADLAEANIRCTHHANTVAESRLQLAEVTERAFASLNSVDTRARNRRGVPYNDQPPRISTSGTADDPTEVS
jgi:hypothetical protein